MRGKKARALRAGLDLGKAADRKYHTHTVATKTLITPEDVLLANPGFPERIEVSCFTVTADYRRHYYQRMKGRRPRRDAQVPHIAGYIRKVRAA